MITIYILDAQSCFVCAVDVDPMSAMPHCALTAPPPTTGTEVAQWGGGAWQVLPVRPLVDLRPARAEKKEAIKAERDWRKFAGVQVGTDWFHCDLESRSQWERMANKAAKLGLTGATNYTIGGQPVPWKTMAGTFVVLTAGKIFAVVDAIELQEAMVFGRAEQHMAAMAASADPAAYDFSTGWPAVFGG